MSLFWRIFLLNAVVLVVAAGLLLLTPATVSSSVVLAEALILVAGLAVMLFANGVLLRIGLAPLQRLTHAMTTTDLLHPGPRPAVSGQAGIADLIRTFNVMLDRLEAERASSTARALSAQEAERSRIARELHDEIGQTMTAMLLELKRVGDHAPAAMQTEIRAVQETTRDSLDEIRRIARRLRPGVLEELGLISALRSLVNDVTEGITVERHFDADLPQLSPETELVVYRVAQEAITNTLRHAQAHWLRLSLRHADGAVRLRVADDGRGIGGSGDGAGIPGMRERALLVGARLYIGELTGGGTEVRLDVPTSDK